MNDSDWHGRCFYRVSIKAVITDGQGRILVVREKNNPKWNLPGGGMDYGEDERQALKRELYEEVGYTGDFTFTPLGIRPMYLKEQQAWQLWVVYKIIPDNFDFKVGEEATEIAFFDPNELKDLHPHVHRFGVLAREA